LFPKMEDFSRLDKNRNRMMRARYDNALNANSALQNLLRREAQQSDARELMGSENFYTLTVGRRDFTRSDAEWVYINGQGENFSLRDTSLSEDIFVRDEVSAEETFKVAGLPLRPYFSNGPKLRPTKAKVGLYQINQTMEEWSENLLERLKIERDAIGRPLKPQEVAPIFNANREWVNDDTGLIDQAHRLASNTKQSCRIGLVSQDKRLANQMAETCNATVIRLHPREFARLAHQRNIEIHAEIDPSFLLEYGDLNCDHVLVDTGSLSAAAVRLAEEDGVLYSRTLHETGWSDGVRYSKITLTALPRTRLVKQVHRPVTRPKLTRAGSRPYESSYSSHSSWKESLRSSASESSWWRGENPPLATRSWQKANIRSQRQEKTPNAEGATTG
jgi:hypothetical protein